MGELGAFLKIHRSGVVYRDPEDRVDDYKEFLEERPDPELRSRARAAWSAAFRSATTAARSGNLIPDWNDLVYRDRWPDAIRQLHATNNFPEFTGRLCPAPCEAACVLEIREGDAVTIKQIENSIIERAWAEGWVEPQPPRVETGRSVAVIGAGPAGHGRRAAAAPRRPPRRRSSSATRPPAGWCASACRTSRSRSGSSSAASSSCVAEGVELRCGVDVGVDMTADELRAAVRRGRARDGLARPARPARSPAASSTASTSRWTTSTCATAGSPPSRPEPRAARPIRAMIAAKGKHVIVIGGGDTGADCVGQLAPRGRRVGHPARAAARAARAPARRPHAVAAVAAEVPPVATRWRRGRRSASGEQDFSIVTTHFDGRGRPRHGLHHAQAEAARRSARSRARRAS